MLGCCRLMVVIPWDWPNLDGNCCGQSRADFPAANFYSVRHWSVLGRSPQSPADWSSFSEFPNQISPLAYRAVRGSLAWAILIFHDMHNHPQIVPPYNPLLRPLLPQIKPPSSQLQKMLAPLSVMPKMISEEKWMVNLNLRQNTQPRLLSVVAR